MRQIAAAAVNLLLVAACAGASAADWPQWRGPEGNGVSPEEGLPERWSATEGVRWRAELPGRGLSCPVTARGRVFVTAASGAEEERLHLLCIEARSGRPLWERRLRATGATQCHPKTSMAAPTPAADGERVVALFASMDLACFDLEGKLLWYRSLALDHPAVSNQVGMAASPLFWEGLVILALETDSESLALGIDGRTGINRWRVPRPIGINWTTPLLVRRGVEAEVLFQSRGELAACDPHTGAGRWLYRGQLDSIASPVTAGGTIFMPAGEVIALRPKGQGPEPEGTDGDARVLWRGGKLRASTASPLVYRGRVYALSSAGVLSCADAADGKLLWQERLQGPFSASPAAGDGKVYCVSEEGVTAVVRVASEEGRVMATNALGEGILASPAISDGTLYLRAERRLYAIGAAEKAGGAGRGD